MSRKLVVNTAIPVFNPDNNLLANDHDILFEPAQNLTVNRERCINPVLVDNFFRFLRHGSDDVLKQKLNNFKLSGGNENRCDYLLTKVLYPNWKIRNDIIAFCEGELASMKQELSENSEDTSNMAPVLSERLDPYSVKDRASEMESRFKDVKSLENWVSNQKDVESIIQIRTSSLLGESCGVNADYIKKFEEFIKTHR